MKIISGIISSPLRTVIYGVEGIGKTTLAAAFPNPLFMDLENGSRTMDVRRIDPPVDWESFLEILREVGADPSVCNTLVIDTADIAEQLCISYICNKYKKASIESFGFGKGYVLVAEEIQRMLILCDKLVSAGINVVILAHAKLRRQELPDDVGSYDRWELKLSKHAAPLLKEWCDLLLFLNNKLTLVDSSGTTKKAQGGQRVMYTSHHPCWDAKNRFGLPDMLPLDYSKISALPFTRPVEPPLDKLRRLMQESGITEAEIQHFVSAKGKYPEETLISDYSFTLLTSMIAKWPQIERWIRSNRTS